MKLANETNSDAQLLDRNVQKTVAISALKHIQKLADQVEAEEQASKLFTKRVALVVALALLVLAITLIVFGPGPILGALRSFTGSFLK